MPNVFSRIVMLQGAAATTNLQQRIYQTIRQAALNGVLPPGTRLASTRALALELGVSRTTTMLAYEQLLAEGYLESRHGSGTYVAGNLPDDAPTAGPLRDASPTAHPPLSRRGLRLASIAPPARRLPGAPPRPFRVGVPALDVFPTTLWRQLASRAAAAVTPDRLDYADAAGLPALREAIARHVTIARATHCTPDQILVVAGAQRGLDLVCRLLLDPGDEAWLEEPGYAGAHSALVAADARIVPVPVDAQGLDVAAGTEKAPAARLAYVTPSHQFPTGVPMSLPRRLALLNWARHANAWILEDDYDSEFRYGTRSVPSLHGLDPDGRVIYVGSFSKSLFPALRLGFLIVPRDLVPALLDVRRASDVHPPVANQATLAAFIANDHYERHLRRMRKVYRERLDALQEAIARHCSGAVRLRPVTTGLHAVADLEDMAAETLADRCAARGVEVTPMTMHAMTAAPAAQSIVLGFGAVAADRIEEGVRVIGEALRGRQPSRSTTRASQPDRRRSVGSPAHRAAHDASR